MQGFEPIEALLAMLIVHSREGKNTDCLPLTHTIGVAGPLVLAAMQGRMAHSKSMPTPTGEELLHVKGTMTLAMDSYAAKKDDRAEIWLVQGTQQIPPNSAKLDGVGTESCQLAESESKMSNEVFVAKTVWKGEAIICVPVSTGRFSIRLE